MNVFNVKGISKPTMSLLVAYEYENGVATKTEGAASVKSSFKFKTVEFKAFVIATHFVLSEETLDDLDEALDEISIVAPDKIQDSIDSKVLGSSGDDSTDIAGILTSTKRTAYATALGAGTIDNATIIDVIADAKLQCENNKYRPTHVYLNPTDVAKVGAAKNTLGDSKGDRRVVFNSLGEPVSVCGLVILRSNAIASNACIVFDIKAPWIGRRKELTMEISNANGTDFVENQKTVKFSVRLAFGVRDKAAIIYVSSISAAATALETA
jgi:HK97 family phage major capsid protein